MTEATQITIGAEARCSDGVCGEVTIELALLLDCPGEVLHIVETDVIEELAVDVEPLDAAWDVAADNVNRLRAAGVAGGGHLLRIVGDHGDVGRCIADFANQHHAQMIVIGTPSDTEVACAFSANLTDNLIQEAHCAVHVVPPGPGQKPSLSTKALSRQ